MDLNQYLELFIDEANEHLQTLNEQMLILENEPDNLDTINEIFRAIHSLKGIAGSIGFIKTQGLTHKMEDVFFEIRYGQMVVTQELIDALFYGLDILAVYADNIADTGDEGDIESEELINNLKKILDSKTSLNRVNQLDEVEIESVDIEAIPSKDIKDNQKKKSMSVRVENEKLDDLMNLVSELIIAKNALFSLEGSNNNEHLLKYNEKIEYLEKVTTNIHESVMKIRMVSLENVFNRFPRMVRDLSKKLDKKIELSIKGKETELDRTVIDEISDPLMHLIRNAADHGLESNEQRLKLGKPYAGRIKLDAYQEGNNVVIEVGDDGPGISVRTIRQKSIDMGLYSKRQANQLEDEELLDLLFQPGFTTSDKVTDVSGRGVGLDIVRTNIASLSGTVSARSKEGQGTTFIVRLPLTLAIVQALMIKIGSEKYAVPISNIESVEEVNVSDIIQLQNKQIIVLRKKVVPIVYLEEIIDLDEEISYTDKLTLLIVNKGDKKIGVVIGELIGQQDIVVKSIGKHINNDKIISGVTILGNGELALILELKTLV